eukprot:GHVT01024213.1.p1 GENE.GHVT01024213.1~~GHVT01024213.1.p1  ORF type:complete len:650 (-),score=41.90 GHVT01024213.1:58-2007(-)
MYSVSLVVRCYANTGNVARAMVVAFALGFAILGRSALASGAEASGGEEIESTKPPQNVVAFFDDFIEAISGESGWRRVFQPHALLGKLDVKPLIFLKQDGTGPVFEVAAQENDAVLQPLNVELPGDWMMELFANLATKSDSPFGYQIQPYTSQQMTEYRICANLYPGLRVEFSFDNIGFRLLFQVVLKQAIKKMYAAAISFYSISRSSASFDSLTETYKEATIQHGLAIFVAPDKKLEQAYPRILIETSKNPIPIIVVLESSAIVGHQSLTKDDLEWPKVITGSLNFLTGGVCCTTELNKLKPVTTVEQSSKRLHLKQLKCQFENDIPSDSIPFDFAKLGAHHGSCCSTTLVVHLFMKCYSFLNSVSNAEDPSGFGLGEFIRYALASRLDAQRQLYRSMCLEVLQKSGTTLKEHIVGLKLDSLENFKGPAADDPKDMLRFALALLELNISDFVSYSPESLTPKFPPPYIAPTVQFTWKFDGTTPRDWLDFCALFVSKDITVQFFKVLHDVQGFKCVGYRTRPTHLLRSRTVYQIKKTFLPKYLRHTPKYMRNTISADPPFINKQKKCVSMETTYRRALSDFGLVQKCAAMCGQDEGAQGKTIDLTIVSPLGTFDAFGKRRECCCSTVQGTKQAKFHFRVQVGPQPISAF